MRASARTAQCLIMSMGYLIGGFARRAQGANSLTLLIAFPMMFLGGTYFGVSQSTGILGTIVRVIPLSHLNDALRGLMSYGGSGYSFGLQTDLIVLAVWTVLAAIAASRLWRFTASA